MTAFVCAPIISHAITPDTYCTSVPSCRLALVQPPLSFFPSRVTPFLGASFALYTLQVFLTILDVPLP